MGAALCRESSVTRSCPPQALESKWEHVLANIWHIGDGSYVSAKSSSLSHTRPYSTTYSGPRPPSSHFLASVLGIFCTHRMNGFPSLKLKKYPWQMFSSPWNLSRSYLWLQWISMIYLTNNCWACGLLGLEILNTMVKMSKCTFKLSFSLLEQSPAHSHPPSGSSTVAPSIRHHKPAIIVWGYNTPIPAPKWFCVPRKQR